MRSRGYFQGLVRICCVFALTLATIGVLTDVLLVGAPVPAPRLLPLRGEELLHQLRRPVPSLVMVSVSPDGATVAYLEVIERAGPTNLQAALYPNVWGTAQASATLWVVDVARGRRFALPTFEQRLRWMVRVDGRPKVVWSADGKQLAALEQRQADAELVLWNVGHAASPTATQLPGLSEALDDGTIRNWAWFSERDEVLVGVESDVGSDDSADESNTLTGAAWFLSHFQHARERRLRAGEDESHPSRLVVVSGSERRAHEVTTPDTRDYVTGPWAITRDRRRVLIATQDPRISRNWQVRQWQMRLLDTQAPGAGALDGAESAVYAVDPTTRTVRPVYRDGPGYIASIAPLGIKGDLAIAQNQPTLAVWPGSGVFGTVFRFASASDRSEPLLDTPVVLSSTLYASDRLDVLYQHEKSYPEHRLYQLAGGVRTILSPRHLSATDMAVSADGATIAAVLQSVAQQPEVYIWRTLDRRWHAVTDYARTRPPEGRVGRIEKITWRSKDNRFDLDGFLVTPHDFSPAKRYPLLVFVHGGPTAGYSNSFDPLYGEGGLAAHVFAEAGYLVFLPNMRGDRGYSLEFSRAVLGNIDKTYDDDIDAGVNHLIAKGLVHPDKLGILGHSGGSIQVARALAVTTRYKAAVVNDGPLILADLELPEAATFTGIPQGAPNLPDALRILFGVDPVEAPLLDPFLIRTPLLVRWSRMTAPLQGETGAYVYGLPFEYRFHALAQSKKLAYALKRNGVPFEVIIDRDEHWLMSNCYLLEYQSRLLQWFDYFVLRQGANPLPAMPSSINCGHGFDSADQ